MTESSHLKILRAINQYPLSGIHALASILNEHGPDIYWLKVLVQVEDLVAAGFVIARIEDQGHATVYLITQKGIDELDSNQAKEIVVAIILVTIIAFIIALAIYFLKR